MILTGRSRIRVPAPAKLYVEENILMNIRRVIVGFSSAVALGLCIGVLPPAGWAQGGGAGGGGAGGAGSGMGTGGPSVGTGTSGGIGPGSQGSSGAGAGTNANGKNSMGSANPSTNPQEGGNTYQPPGAAGVPPPGTPINPGHSGTGNGSGGDASSENL